MIYSTNYRLRCDVCGADAGLNNANQFRIWDDGAALGWRFRRRKDGRVADRGGKDYCPKCVPGEWQ